MTAVRYRVKIKMNDFDDGDSSGSQKKMKKMLPSLITVSMDQRTNAMDEKEYSCHKREMKEEMEKKEPNVFHIHHLL